MTDEQIRDKALSAFQLRAASKFNAGIREHNPDGTKGLSRMATLERIYSAQDEVMDLWFYLYTEELSALGWFEEGGNTDTSVHQKIEDGYVRRLKGVLAARKHTAVPRE